MNLLMSQRSDKGHKHETNEDSCLVAHNHQLCAVADGMSVTHGDVASQLAVKVLEEYFSASSGDKKGCDTILHEAVHAANFTLHRYAMAHPTLLGMGTTITAVKLMKNEAFIAQVGDSCCFKVSPNHIQRLTEIHTTFLGKDRTPTLSRSVGIEAQVEVDLIKTQITSDDFLLLCTDGLSQFLDCEEFLRIFQFHQAWAQPRSQATLERISNELIRAARIRGSNDDITIVICHNQTTQPL